jgi:hypothetical protein
VSFAAIILCVASQRVFIVAVVYFDIDPVRKLLNTPCVCVCVCRTYDNSMINWPRSRII